MAGQIIGLVHEAATRSAIVWDDAVEGDPRLWLVQWATTPADVEEYQQRTGVKRELDKPFGEPFLIQVSGDQWASVSAHYPASGQVADDGRPVGEYRANDEQANGVAVMAEYAAQRTVMLDEFERNRGR
jgi:hypothetical protein